MEVQIHQGFIDDLDRLFNKRSWRYWTNKIFNAPKMAWRETQWFLQRGKHGFADSDVWDADYAIKQYLIGIIEAFYGRYCSDEHIKLNPESGVAKEALLEAVRLLKIPEWHDDEVRIKQLENLSHDATAYIKQMQEWDAEKKQQEIKAFSLIGEYFHFLWD